MWIIKSYNDLRVVSLEITIIDNEEDKDKVYEAILYGIKSRMNEWILIRTFGSMGTDDKTTRGYYLVKCLSELYIVQESIITKRFET